MNLSQFFLSPAARLGCGLLLAQSEPANARQPEAHGALPVSGVRSLDVTADSGPVDLLIAVTMEGHDKPVLQHLRSDDHGATWSAPVRVDAKLPPAFSAHRGMDPQIAAAGNRLVAVWMTAGTDAWGSGPMVTSLSNDGGKTWQSGPNPADDGSTTGHGFIDIAADRAGAFHLTWLDKRDGQQGLRYARSIDAGRTWSANTTLQSATCECCANHIAIGPANEISILFRDKDPRDMAASVSRDGGVSWQPPARVGAFDWKFGGCPHVGGATAFGSAKLHAIVWTGQQTNPGVYYLAAEAAGEKWSAPQRLGEASASHPDLAAGSNGKCAAVWDSHAKSESAIEGAVSADHGKTWSAPMRLTAGPAAVTHPRLIATPRGFRVFWTETAPGKPAAWRSAILGQP